MKVSLKGALIDNVHTDFAVINFKDNILIIVTQLKKPGCFISSQKVGEGDNAVYSLSALLGEDETFLPVARYLHEKLAIPRSTVFSLALLSDVTTEVIDAMSDVLKKMKAW